MVRAGLVRRLQKQWRVALFSPLSLITLSVDPLPSAPPSSLAASLFVVAGREEAGLCI